MKLNICDLASWIKRKLDGIRYGFPTCEEDSKILKSYLYDCKDKLCVVKEICTEGFPVDVPCDITIEFVGQSIVTGELLYVATPSGGTSPYTFIWSESSGNWSIIQVDTATVSNATFTYIGAPSTIPVPYEFNLVVTDINGCVGNLQIKDDSYAPIPPKPECELCLYPNEDVQKDCIWPSNHANKQHLKE